MNNKFNRVLLFSVVITFVTKVADYFYGEFLINAKILVSSSAKSYLLVDISSFVISLANPITRYISLFIDMNTNVFFSLFNVFDFAFWVVIVYFILTYKKRTAVGIPLFGAFLITLGNYFIFINAGMYFARKSLMGSPLPNLVAFMLLGVGVILICSGFGLLLWAKWGRVLSLISSAILAILSVYIIAIVHGEIGRQGVNNVHPKIMGIYYLALISLFLIAGFVYYLTRLKVKEQFQ